MRLRRYEVWVTVDVGLDEPTRILKGKCFTRRGAEWLLTNTLGDSTLLIGLMAAKVFKDVDARVTGEVVEVA